MWKTICGYYVLVEDGRVIRGVSSDNTTSYVYRRNRRFGGWDREESLTISAFRSGVRRGTIQMF